MYLVLSNGVFLSGMRGYLAEENRRMGVELGVVVCCCIGGVGMIVGTTQLLLLLNHILQLLSQLLVYLLTPDAFKRSTIAYHKGKYSEQM